MKTNHQKGSNWFPKEAKLRLDAAVMLATWCSASGSRSYEILRQLCGRGPTESFVNFTEDEKYKCELLVGPHGYTFFKMMCIKMGLTDLLKTQNDTKGSV